MEFNGTFLVTIISFLVFVYLMNKVLYDPIRKISEDRQIYINDNLNTADSNKSEAQKIIKDKDLKIQEARHEAKDIYVKKVNDFKTKQADIVRNAKENSASYVEEACQNLNNVSNDAKERLKGSMTDLANDIVEKVIGYKCDVTGFDSDTVNRILYH